MPLITVVEVRRRCRKKAFLSPGRHIAIYAAQLTGNLQVRPIGAAIVHGLLIHR